MIISIGGVQVITSGSGAVGGSSSNPPQSFSLSLASFGASDTIAPAVDAAKVYEWLSTTDTDHSYGTFQTDSNGDIVSLHQDGSSPWSASIASTSDIRFESQSADVQNIAIEVRVR